MFYFPHFGIVEQQNERERLEHLMNDSNRVHGFQMKQESDSMRIETVQIELSEIGNTRPVEQIPADSGIIFIIIIKVIHRNVLQ